MKRLAIQGFELDLWHAKQLNPWGCMYHAHYAATGDERFLANVDDMNTEGVARLNWRLGFWPLLWFTQLYDVRADEAVWRGILAKCPGSYSVWLASIDSLRFDDTKHSVAVALNLPAGSTLENVPFAVVSCSSADDFVHYDTLEAFLASPYAGAYDITSLYRLPATYAPEMVWTINAPHLRDFDWTAYSPSQTGPVHSPAGGDSP